MTRSVVLSTVLLLVGSVCLVVGAVLVGGPGWGFLTAGVLLIAADLIVPSRGKVSG